MLHQQPDMKDSIGNTILQTKLVSNFPAISTINFAQLTLSSYQKEDKETIRYRVDRCKAELDMARTLKQDATIPALLQNVGIALYFEGRNSSIHQDRDLREAISYFMEAFTERFNAVNEFLTNSDSLSSISSETELHLRSISDISHYLARIYHALANYDCAEIYYKLDLAIRAGFISHYKRHDDYISRSCLHMGFTYTAMNRSQQAIEYYTLAITAQESYTVAMTAQGRTDQHRWVVGRARIQLAQELLGVTHLQMKHSDTAQCFNDGHTTDLLKVVIPHLLIAIEIYQAKDTPEYIRRLNEAALLLLAVNNELRRRGELPPPEKSDLAVQPTESSNKVAEQAEHKTEPNPVTSSDVAIHVLQPTPDVKKIKKAHRQPVAENKESATPNPQIQSTNAGKKPHYRKKNKPNKDKDTLFLSGGKILGIFKGPNEDVITLQYTIPHGEQQPQPHPQRKGR